MQLKNKFQPYDFKGVDEFLNFIPEKELRLVKRLRALIFECLPNCSEKLNYNVPFYKLGKNICFIWPASIKWGDKVSYEGVRLGFTKGYLMRDEIRWLETGTRKQIYWKTFFTEDEIDPDMIKTYLFEALRVESEMPVKKKKNEN